MLSFLKRLFGRKPAPEPVVIRKTNPDREPQGAIVPAPKMQTVKQGDSGEAVKVLQRTLQAHGYFDNMTVSGEFGPKTHSAVVHFQQTHIGEDGQPLRADGVVGQKTWWAVFNPSGPGQRQKLADKAGDQNTIIPRGVSDARLAVLEQALLLYLGNTREVPDGSNTGDGVTKFHTWFGMPPAPWCAMAYCWILHQATGAIPFGKKQAHVATLWKLCRDKGMAHTLANDYQPRPGDAFVMVHRDGTGHIGIVVRVSTDGRWLDVFEGNSGNRFALRRRRVGQNDHVGYINTFGDAREAPAFTRGLTDKADGATNQTR